MRGSQELTLSMKMHLVETALFKGGLLHTYLSDWAFPSSFLLYRSTITENCLPKFRRPWALSRMIFYVTLQLVSLTCSYIPTMLCISAAKKDCFSITIIRTLQSWALQETVFERRRMELSSLGPTFQAQGCETGLPLAGKSELKSWILSLGRNQASKKCLVPLPVLDQEMGGAQGASGNFRKATNPGDGVITRQFSRQWKWRAKAGYNHHPISLYCTWCCNRCILLKTISDWNHVITRDWELQEEPFSCSKSSEPAVALLPHYALGTPQWL